MEDIGWIRSGIFRFDVTLFARFLWIMEIDALILFMTTSLGNLSLELQRFILQFVAIWGWYSHSFLLIFFMLKVQHKMPDKDIVKAAQMWSWKQELTIIFNFFWHLVGINVPFSCRQDYQVSTFGAVLIRLIGLYSQRGYILWQYRHSMAYFWQISLLLELFHKAVFWKVTKG